MNWQRWWNKSFFQTRKWKFWIVNYTTLRNYWILIGWFSLTFTLISDENDCQLSQEIRVQWQRRRNTSFLQKHENFRIVELLELTLWNYWNGCFSLTLTIISEWIWIQDCISIYYLWEFRRGIQLMYANGTNEVNMVEDWIGWFSLIFTLLRYENDCQSTARVDCMLEKARKAVASLDLVIYSALNG